MIKPVTISEYAQMIARIAARCKANGIDPECYYASDEEGNSFQPVYNHPGMTLLNDEGFPIDYDPAHKEDTVIVLN